MGRPFWLKICRFFFLNRFTPQVFAGNLFIFLFLSSAKKFLSEKCLHKRKKKFLALFPFLNLIIFSIAGLKLTKHNWMDGNRPDTPSLQLLLGLKWTFEKHLLGIFPPPCDCLKQASQTGGPHAARWKFIVVEYDSVDRACVWVWHARSKKLLSWHCANREKDSIIYSLI